MGSLPTSSKTEMPSKDAEELESKESDAAADSTAPAAAGADAAAAAAGTKKLLCPRCDREFDSSEVDKFKDHVDKCEDD